MNTIILTFDFRLAVLAVPKNHPEDGFKFSTTSTLIVSIDG
ncbi:hypothetical protein [Nostoc sp. JL33]|nr:hypothetical protein [Nostoc sp. JL33]